MKYETYSHREASDKACSRIQVVGIVFLMVPIHSQKLRIRSLLLRVYVESRQTLGRLRLRPFRAAFAYQFDGTFFTSLNVPTFYKETNDNVRFKRILKKAWVGRGIKFRQCFFLIYSGNKKVIEFVT